MLTEDILYYHSSTLAPCHRMVVSRIDFYELTFLLEGSFTYIVDGQVYPMVKNDAVLLKPNAVRQRITNDLPVQYVSFNFKVSPGTVLPQDVYLPNCINGDIRKLISAYPYRHLLDANHAREKLFCILDYILYEIGDRLHAPTDNEHVLKILRYIDTHLTEPVTLSEMSRHVNLTKEYTSAIFRKEMGTTLTGYVNQRKMLLAKELISHREMTLSDIAAYLGYENYNYFSRTFTRYYGKTPISIRNNT